MAEGAWVMPREAVAVLCQLSSLFVNEVGPFIGFVSEVGPSG
jgi:hypothetical protein